MPTGTAVCNSNVQAGFDQTGLDTSQLSVLVISVMGSPAISRILLKLPVDAAFCCCHHHGTSRSSAIQSVRGSSDVYTFTCRWPAGVIIADGVLQAIHVDESRCRPSTLQVWLSGGYPCRSCHALLAKSNCSGAFQSPAPAHAFTVAHSTESKLLAGSWNQLFIAEDLQFVCSAQLASR